MTTGERWEPDEYMRRWFPDVQVVEMELSGDTLGCVDHRRRIIWLAVGLSSVVRRCTHAYELGQLVIGPAPADPALAVLHQRAAADWAAQMLIPTEDLFDAFASCNGYASTAAYLRVDVPTLRARLRGMSDAEQDGVLEAIHRNREAMA